MLAAAGVAAWLLLVRPAQTRAAVEDAATDLAGEDDSLGRVAAVEATEVDGSEACVSVAFDGSVYGPVELEVSMSKAGEEWQVAGFESIDVDMRTFTQGVRAEAAKAVGPESPIIDCGLRRVLPTLTEQKLETAIAGGRDPMFTRATFDACESEIRTGLMAAATRSLGGDSAVAQRCASRALRSGFPREAALRFWTTTEPPLEELEEASAAVSRNCPT